MVRERVEAAPSRRPSISDVARAAGVSRAAVSKVIRNAYGVSPAMRERVETTIHQLNYRPRVGARAMRGSGFTVGFEAPHMGNEYFNQLLTGAAPGLAGSQYQLIIAPDLGYLSGAAVLEALVDRQVDGIIAIASTVAADWLEELGAQMPLVVIGRHEPSQNYDTVTGDDVAGTDLVMDHLLGLGHRRIAHLTLAALSPRAPHGLRHATYLERMQRVGCEPQVVIAETEHDGYETAQSLLQQLSPPTAIFAAHDALALETLHAVADAGADMSVVGYDNIDMASHPLISLTTVDQFGMAAGAAASELLMQRIRGSRTTPEHVQLDPQLRARRSSRPV